MLTLLDVTLRSAWPGSVVVVGITNFSSGEICHRNVDLMEKMSSPCVL